MGCVSETSFANYAKKEEQEEVKEEVKEATVE